MRKVNKEGESDLPGMGINQEAIKPDQAAAILRKHGLEVTPEQAKGILEFLQTIADITVAQYLRK